MSINMPIEEAALNFRELLEKVRRGETVILTHQGDRLAQVTQAGPRDPAELDAEMERFRAEHSPDPSFGDDVGELRERSRCGSGCSKQS